MRVSGYLTPAGSALVKKYQIGEAMSNRGVPVEIPTLANTSGVLLVETTTAILGVGITLDAQGTRNTAQQTDGSDPAAYVSLDVRPDAIIQARLAGGSTSGTALSEFSVTSADTAGTTVNAPFTNTYDDGYCWGATGANAGILRKMEAVDATSATIEIAFPRDIDEGDLFYAVTFGPAEDAGVQLTSDLTEVDATGDNQSGDNFRCVDIEQRPKGENGDLESYAFLTWFDHMFGACSPST